MGVNHYELAVKPVLHGFNTLQQLCEQAAKHCAEHGIDEAELLSAKLYDDMFDLAMQAQAFISFSLQSLYPLAGEKPQLVADEVGSFKALQEKLARAKSLVEGFGEAAFVSAQDQPVQSSMPRVKISYDDRSAFIQEWVLPNIYFHSTTFYDILRHNGVKLGKTNYLGRLSGSFNME